MNGLLLSRIDRLDEGSRGVLRLASVIGQRIPFGVQLTVVLVARLTDSEVFPLLVLCAASPA